MRQRPSRLRSTSRESRTGVPFGNEGRLLRDQVRLECVTWTTSALFYCLAPGPRQRDRASERGGGVGEETQRGRQRFQIQIIHIPESDLRLCLYVLFRNNNDMLRMVIVLDGIASALPFTPNGNGNGDAMCDAAARGNFTCPTSPPLSLFSVLLSLLQSLTEEPETHVKAKCTMVQFH